jgi:hypothetical protein
MKRRSSTARQPFDTLWTAPCTTIAAGTGSSSASTPIRIRPPAMPNTAERKAVARTLKRIIGMAMRVLESPRGWSMIAREDEPHHG